MKTQFVKLMMFVALFTMALAFTTNAKDFVRYTAKVDFDFMVGEQKLPAGEYSFQVFENDGSGRLLVIRNKQTDAQALLNAIPTPRSSANSTPLTFNKYGEQHFISEVALGDFTYQAIKTSTERKLAK